MANLYGTANPLPLATRSGNITAGDIVCPPGVETNVVDSTPLIAISPGFYYPVVYYQFACLNGATAPTGLNFGIRIGAGADFTSVALPGQLNTANYCWFFGGMTFGPTSGTIWQTPGAHIYLACTPQGSSVTVLANGTYGQFFLYRAPDQ